MDGLFYTNEKNVTILLSLLKANNIKKIIVSPGATNFTFVGSIQNDPFFEIYSCVDERSAAYMACGMAAESGEPVVLSCTGATASRDYYPGMTEAYYRKLPVLAVTSHQGTDRIGHLLPQNIDRRHIPSDVALLSLELPVIKDERDEAFVTIEANKAILELKRNGGGPVHINLFTTYSKDFSVKQLPKVRVLERYQAWDILPEMPQGRIAVYVGSHRKFTSEQVESIENFCGTYNAIVVCDHTSGYYGKYRLLPTLTHLQTYSMPPIGELDLMIHIGEVSATTFLQSFKAKQVWRVNPDGELRDTFKKLTKVFQMSETFFFRHYGVAGENNHSFIDECNDIYSKVYEHLPELPLSNIYVAMQLSGKLPKDSLIHISASNTRRSWNQFPLPDSVTSACNVGCCGIDGCTSTLIGASLVDNSKICYLVTGDLAFFYDLNVLGNRHVGNNVRILVLNNGSGAEFQLYIHFCNIFGEDTKKFIAADGHNGRQSHDLLKHIAQDLNYEYLSADDKNEFLKGLERFTCDHLTERPMIFEVFTTPEKDSDALKLMSTIEVNAESVVRKGIVNGIKKVAGESGLNKVKNFIKRK